MNEPNTIRRETDEDRPAIWQVNQAAFESEDEANLVDALRDGGYVELSLVKEVDSQIVGHILFSSMTIVTETGSVPAISLAPMAVLPNHQRRGIGTKLVETGLSICREDGHRIAIVLGHPDYYSRFGFRADLARPLASPFGGGDAWMALELATGALANVTGHAEYSPPFGQLK